MEYITRLLFGKKVYFNDPIIGKLETLVRSKNPSKQYTWTGIHLVSGEKKETEFFLDGTINGPFESQLKACHQITADLQSIMDVMDKFLQLDTSEYQNLTDWKENFTLEAILSLDASKKEFEVIFGSPIRKDNLLVSCYWTNGEIDRVGRM